MKTRVLANVERRQMESESLHRPDHRADVSRHDSAGADFSERRDKFSEVGRQFARAGVRDMRPGSAPSRRPSCGEASPEAGGRTVSTVLPVIRAGCAVRVRRASSISRASRAENDAAASAHFPRGTDGRPDG